jgi:hypothetical protein
MTIKEKKKAEEKAKRFEEEKVKMKLYLANIIHGQRMKYGEDTLKMKKI